MGHLRASREAGFWVMGVTRKEIATAAGVAASTVGMILSGSGERYSAETQRKVLEAAERLGYRRNLAAKALRLQRSLLIGVLYNEVNAVHSPHFLRGLQDALAPEDYSPLIFFNRSEAEQQVGLNHCLNRRVDALFVNCTVNRDQPQLEAFAKQLRGLPLPVIEFFGKFLPGTASINVDHFHGGKVAVEYLVGLGHRRIVLMTHSRHVNQALHRDAFDQAQGYQAAMTAAGLDPRIIALDFDYATVAPSDFANSGSRCLDAMGRGKQRPTAVICYADFMAYGLNRACQERGMRVPDEISIVGNGNLQFSEMLNPPLSTTGFDAFEIGFRGAQQLLGALTGKPLEKNSTVLPQLILRQSSGPVTRP